MCGDRSVIRKEKEIQTQFSSFGERWRNSLDKSKAVSRDTYVFDAACERVETDIGGVVQDRQLPRRRARLEFPS
jgi:hypothetical protein